MVCTLERQLAKWKTISLAILTCIIFGSLITYPLKFFGPMVKSRSECITGLVLVYQLNVLKCCVLLKNSNKLNKNINLTKNSNLISVRPARSPFVLNHITSFQLCCGLDLWCGIWNMHVWVLCVFLIPFKNIIRYSMFFSCSFNYMTIFLM